MDENSRNQPRIADRSSSKLLIAGKSRANSKSGIRQRIVGSNPTLSANNSPSSSLSRKEKPADDHQLNASTARLRRINGPPDAPVEQRRQLRPSCAPRSRLAKDSGKRLLHEPNSLLRWHDGTILEGLGEQPMSDRSDEPIPAVAKRPRDDGKDCPEYPPQSS